MKNKIVFTGLLFLSLLISPSFGGLLYFSDHPERVTSRGLLFSGGLSVTFPVRFYFYHQGSKALPDLNLVLQIYNPEFNRPALIKMLKVVPPASVDAFASGHNAGKEFLEKYLTQIPQIITVNPGETCTVWQGDLPPDWVVNGIIDFKIVSGGPVFINLFSLDHSRQSPGFYLLSNAADTHARGVYPNTDINIERIFNLDQGEQEIFIGKEIQDNLLSGRDLKGAYGIIYNLKLKLRNPQKKAGKVKFFFQPRGGAAAMVFHFRGRTWELKPQQAYSQTWLFSVKLRGGETKELELYTLPEGASNYPVKILLQTSWR